MTTEKDTKIKDHPWQVCPGPECPFHIWPVWPSRANPPGDES